MRLFLFALGRQLEEACRRGGTCDSFVIPTSSGSEKRDA